MPKAATIQASALLVLAMALLPSPSLAQPDHASAIPPSEIRSDGPRPLALKSTCSIAIPGVIKRILPFAGNIVLEMYHHREYQLLAVDPTGNIRWSVSLAGNCLWTFAVEHQQLYAAPHRFLKGSGGPAFLLVFDVNGSIIGHHAVPLTRSNTLGPIMVQDGTVVAELGGVDYGEHLGNRVILLKSPGVETDPESILAQGEVEIVYGWSSQGEEEYITRWARGELLLGPRDVLNPHTPQAIVGLRTARAKQWAGRILKIGTLPYFQAEKISSYDERRLEIGDVIHFESGAGIWVNGAIRNVHGYEGGQYEHHKKLGEPVNTMLFAHFGMDGNLKSYLEVPEDFVDAAFGGDDVYILRRNKRIDWLAPTK